MQAQRLRNVFLGVRTPPGVSEALYGECSDYLQTSIYDKWTSHWWSWVWSEIQQDLTAYYDSKIINWIPKDSFYIPLKKLGTLNDTQISKKSSEIRTLLAEQPVQPFVLKLESLEVAPSWNKPRSVRKMNFHPCKDPKLIPSRSCIVPCVQHQKLRSRNFWSD